MSQALDSNSLAFALLASFTPRRAAELRDRWRAGRPVPELAAIDDAACRALADGVSRLGARFLSDDDAEFPEELRTIPEPPIHLFVQGRLTPRGDRPRVGVIGARAASEAGKEIAYMLARDLALAGCVIVSGLARGIDAEAHRGALTAGGETIAVLGCGLDVCYPRENRDLFEAIPKQGALVTEFPLGTPPMAHHFPMRNRVLSGLSDLLILVEGTEKSGARSTVDHALDQGREVWAVPRDILHPGSALPNRLIRDGAPPVGAASDVLDALRQLPAPRRFTAAEPTTNSSPLFAEAHDARARVVEGSTLSERILAALEGAAIEADRLERRLGSPPARELAAALFELELQGRIERLPGGLLARARARR